MSRYIDAEALKKDVENFPNCYNGWSDTYDKSFIIGAIEEQPSINLDDYVPKDFHDKTCEAMSKVHQEEIANLVSVVRCKDCRHWIGETEHYEDREYKACWQLCGQYMNSEFWCKYGEREGE